ncbi:MAG: hypothetical protein GX456_16815, partial [Verrucomicrobia bacterium]|nr:hypothetical protein [Verrucomicrobiota bacterium]
MGRWRARSVWSAAACRRFVFVHKQLAWNQIGIAYKTTCLSPYDHTTFDLAADPDRFSCATADAVGVGRREAFGVRQLAA